MALQAIKRGEYFRGRLEVSPFRHGPADRKKDISRGRHCPARKRISISRDSQEK